MLQLISSVAFINTIIRYFQDIFIDSVNFTKNCASSIITNRLFTKLKHTEISCYSLINVRAHLPPHQSTDHLTTLNHHYTGSAGKNFSQLCRAQNKRIIFPVFTKKMKWDCTKLKKEICLIKDNKDDID